MTHPRDPWREEVRNQARVAVEVAVLQHQAATRTLAYYLRRALAHGLTIDEVCTAGRLDHDAVLRFTDPGAVA